MIKTIRSQSPLLLAILLGLISVSLILFYNLPTLQNLGAGAVGKIDGRTVSKDEFRTAEEGTYLLLTLERGGELPGGEQTTSEVHHVTWQRLVLLSAAAELKLQVTDEEVANAIERFAFLQKNGHYDSSLYDLFIQHLASRFSISDDRFQQIIRDTLLIDKVTEAVIAPVQVPTSEVDRILNIRLGEAKAIVLQLKTADFLSQAPLPAADMEKEYESQLQQDAPGTHTPERRVVAVVPFLLSPADQKLPAAQKTAAKQKLGERAIDFAATALDQAKSDPKAFAAIAAAQGLTAQVTPPFSQQEAPAGLPASLSFNHAAFDLNAEIPVSDAIETDAGYYVLQLVSVTPSAPIPLASIRPQIEKAVRERQARVEMQTRGMALADALQKALAAGKPWDAAFHDAMAANPMRVTAVNLPPFVPADVKPDTTIPDASTVLPLSFTLQPGAVSTYASTTEGGVIVYLAQRTNPPAAKADPIRPQITAQISEHEQQGLFRDWITARMHHPGFQPPKFISETE